jgi:hypothetical protein
MTTPPDRATPGTTTATQGKRPRCASRSAGMRCRLERGHDGQHRGVIGRSAFTWSHNPPTYDGAPR